MEIPRINKVILPSTPSSPASHRLFYPPPPPPHKKKILLYGFRKHPYLLLYDGRCLEVPTMGKAKQLTRGVEGLRLKKLMPITKANRKWGGGGGGEEFYSPSPPPPGITVPNTSYLHIIKYLNCNVKSFQ